MSRSAIIINEFCTRGNGVLPDNATSVSVHKRYGTVSLRKHYNDWRHCMSKNSVLYTYSAYIGIYYNVSDDVRA